MSERFPYAEDDKSKQSVIENVVRDLVSKGEPPQNLRTYLGLQAEQYPGLEDFISHLIWVVQSQGERDR